MQAYPISFLSGNPVVEAMTIELAPSLTCGKPIPCRVRLDAAGVSITSPRTGRSLTVPTSKAPASLRRRIVHTVAQGAHVAAFTDDELRAFLAAATPAAVVEQKPTRVTAGLWNGWRRSR